MPTVLNSDLQDGTENAKQFIRRCAARFFHDCSQPPSLAGYREVAAEEIRALQDALRNAEQWVEKLRKESLTAAKRRYARGEAALAHEYASWNADKAQRRKRLDKARVEVLNLLPCEGGLGELRDLCLHQIADALRECDLYPLPTRNMRTVQSRHVAEIVHAESSVQLTRQDIVKAQARHDLEIVFLAALNEIAPETE